jgi:DNA gyrase subunit A
LQKRGGKGLINIKVTDRNGTVVGILQSFGDDEFMMITDTGKIIRIRVDLESLRTIGRSTQGVKLQDLGSEGHCIMAIAPVLERESGEGEDGEYDDGAAPDDLNGGDYPDGNGLDEFDDNGGTDGSGEPEIVEISEDE